MNKFLFAFYDFLKSKSAQQSVHLTGGILRHFQAFSTPEQNPALEVLSTPAHPQVTHTVGRLRYIITQRIVFLVIVIAEN